MGIKIFSKVMYLAHDKSLNEMSQRAKTSDRELLESIYRFVLMEVLQLLKIGLRLV